MEMNIIKLQKVVRPWIRCAIESIQEHLTEVRIVCVYVEMELNLIKMKINVFRFLYINRRIRLDQIIIL